MQENVLWSRRKHIKSGQKLDNRKMSKFDVKTKWPLLLKNASYLFLSYNLFYVCIFMYVNQLPKVISRGNQPIFVLASKQK